MNEGNAFLDVFEDEAVQGLPSPIFKTGDLCGAYEVEELFARGGSADVYPARHLFLGVRRALKIARHGHTDQSSLRRRFVREARNVVVIDHPYVVKILDGGEHDGRTWIAMELVQGEVLRRAIVPGRPMPVMVALRRFVKICEGVAAVHRHRLIHRDLKPENIMLSGDRPVILDFGIAKRLDPPPLTRTSGQVRGTPAYMSPESLLSVMDDITVDERTDVYSLGHILYEMLLGRHAYSNEDGTLPGKVELMRKHLEPAHGRITPLPDALPGFPHYLWTELEKTLRRDPKERPADAQQLVNVFGPLLIKCHQERLSREEFYDALQTGSSRPGTRALINGGAALGASNASRTRPSAKAIDELPTAPVVRYNAITDELLTRHSVPAAPADGREHHFAKHALRRTPPISLSRLALLVACGVALSFAALGLLHVVAAARRGPAPVAAMNGSSAPLPDRAPEPSPRQLATPLEKGNRESQDLGGAPTAPASEAINTTTLGANAPGLAANVTKTAPVSQKRAKRPAPKATAPKPLTSSDRAPASLEPRFVWRRRPRVVNGVDLGLIDSGLAPTAPPARSASPRSRPKLFIDDDDQPLF